MTSEGRVAMLEAIIAQPMMLCLFVNDEDPGEGAAYTDFDEPDGYAPLLLERSRWVIDEEKAEATAPRHAFKLPDYRGKVYGWMLLRRKDRAVIEYRRYPNPYQFNSDEDTLGVTPSIALTKATA